MRTIISVLIAASFLATNVSAAPLLVEQHQSLPTGVVQNIKIVCEANGYCFRRGRPPVAHWVYGEDAFYGPYNGPRNYGKPGWHSGWLWWGLW